jgi:hypothetical protein
MPQTKSANYVLFVCKNFTVEAHIQKASLLQIIDSPHKSPMTDYLHYGNPRASIACNLPPKCLKFEPRVLKTGAVAHRAKLGLNTAIGEAKQIVDSLEYRRRNTRSLSLVGTLYPPSA